MCDTMVRVLDDRVLFAKNSDRDPNEAQRLEWHPRACHPAGATVDCTWITIPQVRETNAVLLSRPFWMWGAEMGTNEHGVTIGNEAVFTRQPYAKTGLLGMDLLRLALERAATAEAAVETMIALLETHGQGGGCGHENRGFTYHNSFLVADGQGAYVFETAGREHDVARVVGTRTISNALTIPGFAERNTDRLRSAVAAAHRRQARSCALTAEARSAGDLFAVLRDYGPGRTAPSYSIINGGMGAACMHAGGLLAASQTTASWVSELQPDRAQHWATGTSIPSASLFKPVAVGVPVDTGAPSDVADDSLWWRHERFVRRVMRDPVRNFPLFQPVRDALETAWLAHPPESAAAFAEHFARLETWDARVREAAAADTRPFWLRRYWRKRDRMAGIA